MTKLYPAFVLLIGFLVFPSALHAQVRLTDSERRGKQIYLRGTTSSDREITAVLNQIEVPASTVTCAGCHGMRGEGKTEGGVTAGSLTWSHLVKPYGHTHTTGRKHGPFKESSFTRAVVNGVDADGNDLLVAMPRFKLSADDMADLIAYVKRLESDLDPGLTDSSVKIGLLLPSTGALADVGAAMKDVFTAYFDDVNSKGGIFNRKIELQFADAGAGGAATAGIAQSFAQKEQIFAFVGGLSAGADAQLAALARSEEIPFIGPSTLLPYAETPVNRYVFYVLPGVAEQAVSLINSVAARAELRQAKLAIVYSDTQIALVAAAAAEEQAKKMRRTVETKHLFTSHNLDARAVVQDLKNRGVEVVLFFGNGKEQSLLLGEAATVGWGLHLFVLGAMTGKDLPVSSPEMKDKIFIAYPALPADITRDGVGEFRALHEKYKFAPRHTASQLAAFASAKVFVEGLTRAGKDLSRETLIKTLEGFYEYETGATPRITFGPNRRVGAAGAHVLSLRAVEKEFASASGWVKAY
jgi:ABC-type branched-subunit amino acid transport system substrate-binding protein